MSQWTTCLECSEQFQGIRCSCGWQPKGNATGVIFRNTEHEQPSNTCTKEQFGLMLYEAVSLVGAIKQVRVLLGRVAMGELPASDYKQREAKLIEQFRTALLTLNPDEVTQVVRKYPWVAAL